MCNALFTDELYHKVFECSNVDLVQRRELYWTSMITQFNYEVFLLMSYNDRNRQLVYMLGYIDENLSRVTNYMLSEFINFNSAYLKSLFAV